jgi:adenylate cyclase
VLIGAEVEKIVAILLVTLVLTTALVLGRRSLVLAVRGTTARDDLSRFFAPEVAARITEQDDVLRPGFGELRRGVILVCDIRGFTALAARRPPAEVVAILIAYQRRLAPVIQEHGGVIDKFLGDGVLATFGCAVPLETPAASGVRAVLALRQAARAFSRDMAEQFGEPLDLGFALVGGDVLCGTVGDEARLEFTVIGEPVNLASKLEKANRQLGTNALVDQETLAAARREGLGADLAGIRDFVVEVPGAERPIAVFGWSRDDP